MPCQKLGPRHKAWAGGHSNTWRLVLAHTGPRPVGRFCATQLCCFGQPFRQQRAASWGPKKFQAFGATWVAYTCPPWLANAPLLPLALATQTPPDPGGSPASTRCRRHRCSRPQATAWAQRGAKVSHLGGRGCAPEVWAPAVATQRVHWHPTPQAWQNGLFAGAPWCPNGAVSCANSPRRPQKPHGPRHKPPGWQRKPQEGPRPRRGRPCGGTAPPPSSAVLAQGPTHHAAPNGIGPTLVLHISHQSGKGGGHQAPGSFGGRPGALFTLLWAWPKRAKLARPPKRHPALNPAAWRPGGAQRGRRRAPAPPR